MVVDRIAEKHQAVFKKNTFEAEVAEFFINGEKILISEAADFYERIWSCCRTINDLFRDLSGRISRRLR